jgi:hypothetical protein
LTGSRKLVLGLVLALGLVLLGLGWLALGEFSRLSTSFYKQVAVSEARAAADRIELALKPPLAALALTAGWLSKVEHEQLSTPSVTLFNLLEPLLSEQQSLAAVFLTENGALVAGLSRLGRNYLGLLREPADFRWLLLDQDLKIRTPLSPDPAFAAALAATLDKPRPGAAPQGFVWSEPHRLPLLDAPAISASTTIASSVNASQEKPPLLSAAIRLDELRRILGQEQATQRVKPLLFTQDGHALDFWAIRSDKEFDPERNRDAKNSTGDENEGLTPVYASGEQIRSPAVAVAMRAWLAAGRPSKEAFYCQGPAEAWWAALMPIFVGANTLYAGELIPQSDLVLAFYKGKTAPRLLLGGAAVALTLLGLLLYAVRHKSRPPAPSLETKDELLALIRQGESEKLEFKSTLRQNLATGKPGKEIELAALKTVAAFLNTDGGVLLVGVNDEGRILGLAPDNFENDDHALRHFTALLQQHLGLECAPYVDFKLRLMDEQQVLLVRCAPSPAPVFLKAGKEEEFYIRVGPSSRKLSLSQFHGRMAGDRTPPSE